MQTQHDYPKELYNYDYYHSPHGGLPVAENFLRIQDEFAVLCYAFDICKNYLEVETLLDIPHQSLLFAGAPDDQKQNWALMSGKKGILPAAPWKSIYDTMYREGWTTIDQIELIKNEINKKPKGIIDFGGGRGNVSSAISHLGITAGYVDPYGYEKNEIYNQENILSYDFFEEIIKDLDKYDTIIFCASIEHIPENYSKEIIELCKGMKLIIANTITYHPIQASGIEHCTKIDDNFYDKICNTMDSIIYRQGSHLVGII